MSIIDRYPVERVKLIFLSPFPELAPPLNYPLAEIIDYGFPPGLMLGAVTLGDKKYTEAEDMAKINLCYSKHKVALTDMLDKYTGMHIMPLEVEYVN